jgi:diguanylate cyclase (GGDEF)-like protein
MSPANRTLRQSALRQLIALGAIMLVPIILLGFVLAGTYRGEVNQRGLAQGKSEALLMAQSAIQPLLDGRPLAQELTPLELARLHDLANAVVRNGNVRRLRLRNLQGAVVFSDDGSGFRLKVEDEALAAARGHTVVRLTRFNSDAVDKGRVGSQVVEIYMPLYAGAQRSRVGVLELYLPYTPISNDVNAGLGLLYRNLAIGLALLYFSLFAISYRVGRRLRRQVKINTYQAEHDALTDLPNRTLFHRQAKAELTRGARRGHKTTIAIIDLDRFKEINDTLGHQSGDRLLTELGRRLAEHLRAPDSLARFGGDEFGVVLSDLADPELVLRRLRELIHTEIEVSGLPLSVEASIGYVVAPDDGTDIDELLQLADVAMYVAKNDRSGIVRYDRSQNHYDASKLTLVTELRQAIASGQLELHYQPKIDVRTQRVTGIESLVRWQHPSHGLLYPDRFIPLVEQTDLIDDLTAWALRQAIDDLVRLGPSFEDLTVSVNISARNLGRVGFASKVIGELDDARVPAERLIVEVTETAIMADPLRSAEALRELSAARVAISIDDFGSGQTSLALLAKLPINELKIDLDFVRDIDTNSAHAGIVRSIVELGHHLELSVVAEGVETVEALEIVTATGCDLVQGYLYAQPMPLAQLAAWLEDVSTTPPMGLDDSNRLRLATDFVQRV